MITEQRPHTPEPMAEVNRVRGRRRGLIILAAAVLFIPGVAGFIMLRTNASDAGAQAPGAGSPTLIRQSSDGSASEIVSSDDMLQPGAEASSAATSRIKYLLDGDVVHLQNGGGFALNEGVNLEVFVAPYPPTAFNADVDLFITTSDGEPVTDASITVTYDMVFMFHGPFDSAFTNVGGGHYVAPFDFYMYGPWELLTEIDVPGQPSPELALSIYVWPE